MKYKIIMSKNDFFKIHNRIATSNLEINVDEVTFEVELGSLNILKESGYSYQLVDSFKIKLKEFMNKYYLLLIGILFLFSILYINSYRVNSIIFNTATPINDKIKDTIEKSYRKILSLNFSNINYTEFSKNLRNRYVEYPYINVYGKNNNIMVDIYKYDDEYPVDNSNSKCGDIVASKDGIVDEYYVYSGSSLVSKNKYVKKGDVLISGNINDSLVVSRGLVLGYTYEKVVINLPKKEEIKSNTGLLQKYYEVNLFNFSFPISKKNTYNEYDIQTNVKFNVFDIFNIKEIEECEKNVIIKEYNESEASLNGEKQILMEFEKTRIDEKEKIIDIKTYDIVENNNDFTITYILKKYESLGVFQGF